MYVTNIQVAITFDLDNQIILTLGERLKQAQKNYNAEIQILNIPSAAPPEAPRLLFLAQSLKVNIGLNRIDIFISIPNHIKTNIDACLSYCFNATIGLSKILLNDAIKYNWCGIITGMNFPDKNRLQPSLKVVERILPYISRVDTKNHELASLNFQIGFKEPPYFKNITLTGYDIFKLQSPRNNEVYPQLNMTDMEIAESGISILVDINNIPQNQKKMFEDDLFNIIEKNKSTSKSVLDDLNISEVMYV
jgi:hypothetical protein